MKVYVEEFLSMRFLSRKSTYPQLSEQLTVKLDLECFEYVAPEYFDVVKLVCEMKKYLINRFILISLFLL